MGFFLTFHPAGYEKEKPRVLGPLYVLNPVSAMARLCGRRTVETPSASSCNAFLLDRFGFELGEVSSSDISRDFRLKGRALLRAGQVV